MANHNKNPSISHTMHFVGLHIIAILCIPTRQSSFQSLMSEKLISILCFLTIDCDGSFLLYQTSVYPQIIVARATRGGKVDIQIYLLHILIGSHRYTTINHKYSHQRMVIVAIEALTVISFGDIHSYWRRQPYLFSLTPLFWQVKGCPVAFRAIRARTPNIYRNGLVVQ